MSHAKAWVNVRSAPLRVVTTRFVALMAFRLNRRRLGARAGFIQIASPSDTLFPDAGMPPSSSNLRLRAVSQRSASTDCLSFCESFRFTGDFENTRRKIDRQ